MIKVRLFLPVSAIFLFCLQPCAMQEGRGKVKGTYRKALKALQQGEYDKGFELLKKSADKKPSIPGLLFEIADWYHFRREYDSVNWYYDRYYHATDIRPAKHSEMMVWNFFNRGMYGRADTVYSQLTKAVPAWSAQRSRNQLLKQHLEFTSTHIHDTTHYAIEALGEKVNGCYTQYFPALTIDKSQLFYTCRQGPAITDDEDIMVSRWDEDGWESGKSISPNINTRKNEGACTISANGNTLIFTSCDKRNSFGNCDLFFSRRRAGTWSRAKNLGGTINTKFWESQPSLSADGRTLFFSSDRPGGYGGRDLWVSLMEDGLWSKPRNLGDGINTNFDETTPSIHSNAEVLLFSSSGLPGFGGFDLFYSTLRDTLWSKAVNLGFGINDHRDQISLIITPDGLEGFFAKEERDSEGQVRSLLMKIDFSQDVIITRRTKYVRGRVSDAVSGEPLEANIALHDLETGKRKYLTSSERETGKYFFALNEQASYGVFVTCPGYLFEDLSFTTGDSIESETIDIGLNPIQENASLILENIYFPFDSYELDPKSLPALHSIARYLRDYPELSIEISGHTDRSGDPLYNMELSVKRAMSVYNFILDLGVTGKNLRYRGYGDTQIRFDQASQNRRIEIKILKR